MVRAMVKLEAAADSAAADPSRAATNGALPAAIAIATTLRAMPFDVNLWKAQNIWNDLFRRSDRTYWSKEWTAGFKRLGEALNISVDQLVTDEGVSAF